MDVSFFLFLLYVLTSALMFFLAICMSCQHIEKDMETETVMPNAESTMVCGSTRAHTHMHVYIPVSYTHLDVYKRQLNKR